MASQMMIVPSQDTLFLRGFSPKQDIQTIREFFEAESGGCTVEFFKESEQRDQLYIALRFNGKDIARDILDKYDNTSVLGDRINITFFKDLRRARANGIDVTGYYNNNNRQSYGYNGRGGYGYRGRGRRPYYNHRGGRGRPYYGRDRDGFRSESRSRSRSYSRSRSRSRGRDRHERNDRSRSHRSRSRTPRSKTPESRHSTKSPSRSRSPEKKKKKKSRKISKDRRSDDRAEHSSSRDKSQEYDGDLPDSAWEDEHNRSARFENFKIRSTVQNIDMDGEPLSDLDDEPDIKNRSPSVMSEEINVTETEDGEYEKKKSKDSKRSRSSTGAVETSYEEEQYIPEEKTGEKKRRKYADDESPARSSKASDGRGSSMRRERSPFDDTAMNGVQELTERAGVLGLSQDKMALVREKKEEIEKAYRQDCETFSAVVKMLISKNPELEDHLQESLRDNLKDIGQRCIQELREFIESLKVQDSAH